ncbi:hypothetical protein GKZ89_01435 [Bacillus mangrovi]|uniref:GT-D fold-like domain-containing protein n=1 Tax=Metabacillus mangrovi TaxID=1491830 RepID=A0A7X2V3I8_9BACI|nr:GT-D fold domain-containing glycosyltransferase [Metabacillus mangrovi]MTH52051.1 hypothetical protein [Metabacillus mangrovi]
MYHFTESQLKRMALMGYPNLNITDDAYYSGGEYLVEKQVGDSMLLPYSAEEIIAAGAESLKEDLIHLRRGAEVKEQILTSLKEGTGCSITRMGDGPLGFLAHDHLIPAQVMKNDPYFQFLDFAGVKVPDHRNRDLLTEYITKTDYLGVPVRRLPVFQSLFIRLAKFHNWPLKKMNLTHSNINLELNELGTYSEILKKHRVLLIGNRMGEVKEFFERLGFHNIAGTVRVEGLENVHKAIDEASRYSFDAAFAAAGISASVICVELAKAKKTAIDFGQLADGLISGRAVVG